MPVFTVGFSLVSSGCRFESCLCSKGTSRLFLQQPISDPFKLTEAQNVRRGAYARLPGKLVKPGAVSNYLGA